MNYEEMLNSLPTSARRKALVKAAKDQKKIDASSAVKQIREAAHLGQQQLAEALGVSQPAIAKMERQNDMKLSTLIAIVNAAGGSMQIRVKLPNGLVTIP